MARLHGPRDAPGTANDRTIQYSLDDHAYEIASGNGQRTRYWYGPDGQRYQREDADGTRTLYIGQVEVVRQGVTTRYRRNIGGVLVRTEQGASIEDRFVFTDRLGSVVKYTDGNGTVYQPQDYDGWGQRRSEADPTQAGAAPTAPIAMRGFSGHEMVDGQGVIHMNARLYDPTLGRFLQADPLIQAPENLQSWNAYTYVLNNPLTLVDPTGMFSWKKAIGIIAVIVSAIVMPHLATLVAKFWFAVGSGFVSGAVSTGSLRGGLIGAFSAAAFFGIGSAFDKLAAAHGGSFNGFMGSGLSAGEFGAKVLAHGIAGGVMSELMGGKFGDGFAGAAVAQAFAPGIDMIGNGEASYAPLRVAAAALLGGTASVLSGGKFANGAITAAFSQAFNKEPHRGAKRQERRDLPTIEELKETTHASAVRFLRIRMSRMIPRTEINVRSEFQWP